MRLPLSVYFLIQAVSTHASSSPQSKDVSPSPSRIMELFAPLANGNASGFIDVLSDSVTFTSWGSHQFAGSYNKTGLVQDVLAPIQSMFLQQISIDVIRITGAIRSPWAALEARARDGTNILNNGMIYNQTYVWITRWEGEQILEMDEYVDTNLLAKAIEGNLKD